jgi:hypothetical protein
VLFGFLLTVMPLIAVPEPFVQEMLGQSMLDPRYGAPEGAGFIGRVVAVLGSDEVRNKLEFNWIDPFYTPRIGRFMYGSWVDSWVASMFLVGLVWAVLRGWRHRVLLWWVLCHLASVMAVGVLHQYTVPPDTRMLFLVPFYISFAALALGVIHHETVARRLAPRWAAAAPMALAVVVSLAANQYRHRVEAPQHHDIHPFGNVVRLAQTFAPDRRLYFVAPPQYWVDILLEVGRMYHFDDRLEIIRTLDIDDRARCGPPPPNPGLVCEERPYADSFALPAIFIFAHMFPERMHDTQANLQVHFPEHRYQELENIRLVEVPAA